MLEIFYYKTLPSTHALGIEWLKSGEKPPPFLLYANEQTSGIGSRASTWHGGEGNLFLTLCVKEKQLPKDLPLASASVYFAMIVKEIFASKGSTVWVKWPNDLYVNKKKIGGVVSLKTKDALVVSIGTNLRESSPEFGTLDVQMTPKVFVEYFVEAIASFPSWKNIFSKYKLEFVHSKSATCHIDGESVSLRDAFLCEDGSIQIGNKKVYSLR